MLSLNAKAQMVFWVLWFLEPLAWPQPRPRALAGAAVGQGKVGPH